MAPNLDSIVDNSREPVGDHCSRSPLNPLHERPARSIVRPARVFEKVAESPGETTRGPHLLDAANLLGPRSSLMRIADYRREINSHSDSSPGFKTRTESNRIESNRSLSATDSSETKGSPRAEQRHAQFALVAPPERARRDLISHQPDEPFPLSQLLQTGNAPQTSQKFEFIRRTNQVQ